MPVLAEFGEVESGAKGSGYALLVDMSNIVDAEHKALEAAPFGMLKLDAHLRILFATQKAVNLLGLTREELIGRSAREFLADKKSRETVRRQSVQRQRGVGGDFNINIRTRTDQVIELRVTSTPSFDQSGAFSGSILQVQPIGFDLARKQLGTLIATVSDHNDIYDGILKVLRNFIEFDWANLFIYSPKRDYSRIILTRGEPIDFVSRWFTTPNGYVDWLKQPVTWMDDLEEQMSTTAPEYLERVDTQAAIRAGMKALVCLPIRSGKRIIGGFCLASKSKQTYNAASRGILEDLNLEQALLPLFGIVEGLEREFVSELVQDIARLEDMQLVAERVVRGLAEFYKYENVSIFKINALRGQIQLLAQAVGKHGGTPMPSGHSQSVDEGVLGLCLRRRNCVILKDKDDGSKEAQAFLQVAKETRSELCIPIRLFGRILWILNFEDGLADTFSPVEIGKLQSLIQQMQATLERVFQGLILVKLLDVCPAAIIVTDQKFRIVRSNRLAQLLMQKASPSLDDNLQEFLDVSPAALTGEPVAVKLFGKQGRKTEVFASKHTLEEEYDHAVFMLQNIADMEWTAKVETLRAALAETTAQVRVPVSLVSSYVHLIDQEARDDRLRDLAKKAARQLGRIELTYDRVLAAYETQALPAKRAVTVDIKEALRFILDELPKREYDAVSVMHGSSSLSVFADPYRVFFALSSMLSYLLRSRAGTEPIEISTATRGGVVTISMAAVVPKAIETHELAAVIEATRAEIALGENLLDRIAREMSGDFKLQREKKGRERLTLRLKAPAVMRRRS
ncbi:PAS domain-containing protein [Bradyrhizobium quebecense]|uniref:PAS domain-containing protein n=1 Tax=Bradyrhizobium quebecense TaxID=2748629 RepID=A0A974AHZ9_9BRAD|nr:PAS domain-containing protein [Bradyrhizobium quebecense]UGA43468.1 PAS domain-containing protein [Bradyrhizobium quebecense]